MARVKSRKTITKLKALKMRSEEIYAKYSFTRSKLLKECWHPTAHQRTQYSYITDTLGSNGKSYYQDFCTLCGLNVGEEYEGRANFEERRKF